MKVAIAGTSGLAQHIAHAAIARNHEVILLSRFERSDLSSQGLTIIQVDYTRPSSLHTALLGVDTLISTISNEPQLSLVDACLSARVRRFAPSEFQDVPNTRPVVAPPHLARDRMTILHRLREEKHRLESTVFSVGLLYEWFGPGGLQGQGVVRDGGVLRGEAAMLLDYRHALGKVPKCAGRGHGRAGEELQDEVRNCYTAAKDVGKLVALALELESWPEQLRICGQRVTLDELVEAAEEARGKEFDITQISWEDLHDQLLDAETIGDLDEAAKCDALMATQRGEYDFEDANLNALFPEVEMVGLREWLVNAWEGEELQLDN